MQRMNINKIKKTTEEAREKLYVESLDKFYTYISTQVTENALIGLANYDMYIYKHDKLSPDMMANIVDQLVKILRADGFHIGVRVEDNGTYIIQLDWSSTM